jgi:hypothetical protein
MLISHHWHSKAALLMALGIATTAITPIFTTTSATASIEPYLVGQLFPPSEQVVIPAGEVIPVRLEGAEKIIVTPEETAEVTLTVARDIRSNAGTILIREGSQIEGELRPTREGTQFVAQELILAGSDRTLPIEATSDPITDTEIIDEQTDPDFLRGALIGAAAGVVLSEIFGDVDFIDILAGAGVGALAELLLRGREEVEVVVIEPDTDLDLTLESDLVLN